MACPNQESQSCDFQAHQAYAALPDVSDELAWCAQVIERGVLWLSAGRLALLDCQKCEFQQ